MPVISSHKRQKHEDSKFKAIRAYTASSRPASVKQDPVSKKKKKAKKLNIQNSFASEAPLEICVLSADTVF